MVSGQVTGDRGQGTGDARSLMLGGRASGGSVRAVERAGHTEFTTARTEPRPPGRAVHDSASGNHGCLLSPVSCPLPSDPCLAEADPATGEANDVASDVARLLPVGLLQPDELVILFLKPSAWYVILGSWRSLLAIGAVVALLLWFVGLGWLPSEARREIILFAAGCAAVRLVWQFLEWLSRVYVLTDRRVVRVRGVLRINVFESALRHIQHTSTTFNLRERATGLGSIHFATAGTGVAEASWEMIARPMEVHQTVVKALERYR